MHITLPIPHDQISNSAFEYNFVTGNMWRIDATYKIIV